MRKKEKERNHRFETLISPIENTESNQRKKDSMMDSHEERERGEKGRRTCFNLSSARAKAFIRLPTGAELEA